jgi:FMN phosphatase YigB (HAD superfamily)
MFLFDFDGVLMNSVKEAGLSAFNAVNKTRHRSLSALPEGCLDLFMNNIFHFHNPYTLCNLLKWCSENCSTNPDKILSREEFKVYASLQQDIDRATINKYFYSVRVDFMESSPEEWLVLNEPYQLVWNKLVANGAENLIILTAKNRKAVYALCHHYGLKIPDENIYSGDNNLTKMDNFRSIVSRFGDQDYYFIDDHLTNLMDLDRDFNTEDSKSINLMLADWGYGDKYDFNEAEELGYEVISQDRLVSRL